MKSALTTIALMCLTAAGCSDPPTTPSPLPDGGDLSIGSTLSGTVFETTPDGPRPLQGGSLSVTYNGIRLEKQIDNAGRYNVTNLPDGATVSVLIAGAGNLVWGHQPCAAMAVIHGDTVLDVEYNPSHVPGTGGPPRLSGIVSMMLGSERQPLRAMKMQYLDAGTIVAYTFTDDLGRYALCRLPSGTGRLELTDASPWDYGGPYAQETVDIAGDLVIDMEINR